MRLTEQLLCPKQLYRNGNNREGCLFISAVTGVEQHVHVQHARLPPLRTERERVGHPTFVSDLHLHF
jgi:hypothetical protein